MEKEHKTSYSGFNIIIEMLIRVFTILFIPIYLIYTFLSKFMKNVFNDVYGRLVKYTGFVIFVALVGCILGIIKK